jgi:folylpolyglutamate synthase/dihydropteroate synthase
VDPDSGGERARDLPAYLRSALALAERGCAAASALWEPTLAGAGAIDPRAALDLRLPGRLEWGELGGVPYVLDVAHNEAAWLQLSAELSRPGSGLGPGVPLTVLIAVSPGKRTGRLADALESLPALARVIVTRSESMPALEPEGLAASLAGIGVETVAIEDLGAAVGAAFEHARLTRGAVLVFGSTHLVGAVRPRLAGAV